MRMKLAGSSGIRLSLSVALECLIENGWRGCDFDHHWTGVFHCVIRVCLYPRAPIMRSVLFLRTLSVLTSLDRDQIAQMDPFGPTSALCRIDEPANLDRSLVGDPVMAFNGADATLKASTHAQASCEAASAQRLPTGAILK